MADVRLTATNPDDSTVVPVACNEKGELKLEELPDQSFDGNLDGDLNVTGNATFGGDFFGFGDLNFQSPENDQSGVAFRYGSIMAKRRDSSGFSIWSGRNVAGEETSTIYGTGSGYFAGDVKVGGSGDAYISLQINETGGVDGTFDTGDELAIRYNHYYIPGDTNRFLNANHYASALLFGSDGALSVRASNVPSTGASQPLGDFPQCFILSRDGTLLLGNPTGSSLPGWHKTTLYGDGRAEFTSDVIVGSRNKKWMIVESNGLAHLVEQTRAAEINTADLVDPDSSDSALPASTDYPPLRDIPGELTMVEQQLQKVLEKLRMIPEAGWEVWDGSD